MLLREFDLDAPEKPRALRAAFRNQTRCVTALAEREFESFHTDRCWKLLVECVEQITVTTPKNLLGVLCCQHPFDLQAFEKASDRAKKTLALEALEAGAREAAERQGWPWPPFECAFAAVKRKDHRNEWEWGKRASPDRRHRAWLACEHEVRAFSAWCVVQTRDGREVARVKLVETLPSEFVFVRFLGALRWTSNRHVELVSQDGKIVGGVSTEG
jgi:hypothetical protein